ncbi:MAG: hypothetical protein U0R19_28280 [Bryobacteraceae bacterium]
MLFAGLMGFFGMQTGPAAKPTASTAKKASEKKNGKQAGEPIGEKCPGLLPLASYLGAEKAECLNGGIWNAAVWGERLKQKSIHDIWVVVATIPDPDTVTYAHYAHQAVESLRRAAGAIGYSPDRHWFPWFEAQEEESRKLFEPRREDPGGLLFRRFDGCKTDLMLVVLVGETPTRGVHQPALRKALDYARWLSYEKEPLRIVGPSYSGSALSLLQTIEEKATEFPEISIITGTATNPNLRFQLEKPKQEKRPVIRFSAVIENDAEADARLRAFLKDHRKMEGQMAVVTEEGTYYASGLKSGSDVTYTFPMEISQVRNAYQKDPELQEPEAKGGEKRTGLALRFSEDTAGYESIPNWAGETAVFAKEFSLRRLGDQIAEHAPGLIKIGASDVRDVLFVGGFLRQRFDDAQLILLDSDVLYGNTAKTLSMLGALSVATYPLLLEAQAWEQASGRIQFSSQFAHGIFNAFTAHFEGSSMVQYAALPGMTRPPLWMTIYSRGSNWPVALLPPRADVATAMRKSEKTEVLAPSLGPQHAGWMLLEAGLLAVTGGWIFLLLPGRFWARLWKGAARDRAMVAPALLATGLLLGLNTLVLSVQSHYWKYAAEPHWMAMVLGSGNVIAVFLLAATLILLMRRTLPQLWSIALAVGLAGGAVWLAAVVPQMQAAEGEHYTAIFFVHRSYHLSSGVSPVLPLILFLALLLLGAVSQLASRSIAYWLNVWVVNCKDELASTRARSADDFRCAFCWAVGWTCLSLMLFRMYTLSTIESPLYTDIFLTLFGLSIAFLTYAFLRLIRLYLELREVAADAAEMGFSDEQIQAVAKANAWGVWRFHFHNAARAGKRLGDARQALHYAQAAQTLIQMLQCQVVFLMGGIVLGLVAVQCYPFEPSRTFVNYISGFFLVIGAGTMLLFGRIEGAPFLAKLYGTEDKSSFAFYWKTVSRLALPLLAVLAAQFPDFGELLLKILTPFVNGGAE